MCYGLQEREEGEKNSVVMCRPVSDGVRLGRCQTCVNRRQEQRSSSEMTIGVACKPRAEPQT